MSVELQRDAVAGGAAGLIAGLVLALAGVGSDTNGLLDLDLSGATLGLHLLLSAILGGAFGAVFRHQPGAYAALIANGLLFSLLLWIVGPMTVTAPLTDSAHRMVGRRGI